MSCVFKLTLTAVEDKKSKRKKNVLAQYITEYCEPRQSRFHY